MRTAHATTVSSTRAPSVAPSPPDEEFIGGGGSGRGSRAERLCVPGDESGIQRAGRTGGWRCSRPERARGGGGSGSTAG
eukprot:scaffold85325_cov30-Tisochrysis_lutea.AAC.5